MTPSPHPWHRAMVLLRARAEQHYAKYEKHTKGGSHDDAKTEFDQYVDLNTAAAFLNEHLPSGVLPKDAQPILAANLPGSDGFKKGFELLKTIAPVGYTLLLKPS